MTCRPARRRARTTIAATIAALTTAACGWGGEIGAGSRADGDGETESATDGANPPADVNAPVPVVVDRIIDGDSIELIVAGVAVELRLEGYNAPELFTDSQARAVGAAKQTCNGLAARKAVEVAIAAASTIEVTEGGTDRFGRTLGDLMIDGESLVDRLIGEGHGLATGDDDDRRAHMTEAASAGLGVWGSGCGHPVGGGLAIGAIQVDAPGDDRNNLAEEYVEVANTGSEPTDLSGWVLRDDTTSHQFPLTGRLAAGERLKVITGAQPQPEGAAPAGTLHLGESFPVWSNDWETVILVDPDGVFADWRFVADGRVLLQ